MTAIDSRNVNAELRVTAIGLGGTGLGNMYRATDPQDAADTVHTAFQRGIRYFDTAPVYGFGLAESRLGEAIRTLPRDQIVISSKVGYRLDPLGPNEVLPALWKDAPAFRPEFDYSRDAVLRSIEGSLKRLGVDHIDMLAIHDPDEALQFGPGEDPYARSRFREAMDCAYPVLDDLRSQGVVKAVGVGINQWQMLTDFVVAGQFDYFLLAGRYTLLEQESLDTLLPLCEQRGTRLIIGGPFNSGILASGPVDGATFNTLTAPPAVLERVRQLQRVCEAHGVALAAAALQFPLAHPLVASVIPGARSVAELEQNLDYLRVPISSALWSDLKSAGLLAANAPTPSAPEGR